MLMLLNYLLCSIAWIIYGSCINASFVIISNVVGLASVLLLIFQKHYYDQRVNSHVS
jgi:MtN3 and saliva related transmembrane protein